MRSSTTSSDGDPRRSAFDARPAAWQGLAALVAVADANVQAWLIGAGIAACCVLARILVAGVRRSLEARRESA
ncbi:hypothetical protein AB0H76_20435 [Nocardia sp. NPDC050712]|uniref:hypothetical protein n=1 Tax=Nocardia sp. NPDC050712 TaxID=3155518 RepID=UPI0033C6F9FE